MENKVRLNKFLAQCGLGARRKCDEIIKTGHVFVNGQKITELGVQVDPQKDKVEYRGIFLKPVQTLCYYAYHKPKGIIVTAQDPEGRETVFDALIKKSIDCRTLKYVGRLDFNTEGLLLLSNDGDLVHAITHPRFGIKKVYHVQIDRILEKQDSDRLLAGIESEDQILTAGAVKQVSVHDKNEQYWYEVDLYEGKNRQIRRMFDTLGYKVLRLIRVQFGSVKLGELPYGEIRQLTEREIGSLKNSGYKVNS